MTNIKEFLDKSLLECPVWIIEKSVEFLKKDIPVKNKEEIKEMYKNNPNEWWSPHHFTWGMFVRNKLRDNVCHDKELPSQNWDDYYVQMIELACDLR